MNVPHNDALRSLWPLDDDALWATRDPSSKAMLALREIGTRLEGISDVLYALAFNRMAGGGTRDATSVFLASTTKELAMQCQRARALLQRESDSLDEQAIRNEQAAKRKGKKA